MRTKRILIVALLGLAASPAIAVTKNWTGSSGNWSPGNWSPAGLPAASDTVNIVFTDGTARTVTLNTNAPALGLLSIDLTPFDANVSTLAIPGNNNLTAAGISVGGFNGTAFTNGRGAVNQSAGTTTISPGVDLILAWGNGSTGTYTLSGGALIANQTEWVGYAGTGTFNHSAGTNSINPSALGSLIVGNLAGATGTYNLSGTGSLVSHVTEFIGKLGNGTFNQTGGSHAIIGAGTRLQIGDQTASNGTYNLAGGSLTVNDVIMGNAGGGVIPAQGYFNQTGGTLNVAGNVTLGGDVNSGGIYTQTGGVTTIGGQLGLGPNLGFGTYALGNAGVLSANTLRIGNAAIFGSGTFDQTGGTNTIEALNIDLGEYNLYGGLLRFNTYSRNTTQFTNGEEYGVFNFVAGTIQLAGNRGIGTDLAILDLFGSAPTLAAGKGLAVEGTATLQTAVTLDGGTFSAGVLVNSSALHLQRGTLNLTNQAVTIGTGGLLGNTLDLNDDMTVNVTLGITNQGIVTGDGQIGGTFSNSTTGELRGEPGRSLKLTGANNTNAGRINLLGGQVEFTQNLTNNVGGLISGNGSILTGGLTNQGTLNFAGTANVLGDVTNAASGKIISGGGGATIFFDDVTNNGEIRTSANGFTVFFGAVSGSGTFTGTGTVNFEGDLTPGNSPATVNFGGDVVFGPDATLQIELGGTEAGRQYDQINVAGELSLGGTLEISLINGFVPTVGQTFDFIVGNDVTGSFSSIELPTLPGLAWNTSQLQMGVVSIVPVLPGDFDEDGDVDGRDFLAWQRNPGIGNLADWQGNYGAGALSAISVPEPGSFVLMAFFCAAVLAGRGDSVRA